MFWTRVELKANAKDELRKSYWVSFAVCLVGGIIVGGISGVSGGISGFEEGFALGSGDIPIDSGIAMAVIAGLAAISLIALIFSLVYSFFIGNPILVGMCNFFVRAPSGDRQFSNMFSSFKGGGFMNIVKVMLLMDLRIILWSLLLIIPGIIKSYQYRFVAYILSEDPTLSTSEALYLSTRMTDGEKWNMFVLDLSFLGWALLGALACGIGVFFVAPYIEATWAQLYFQLKPKAMAQD